METSFLYLHVNMNQNEKLRKIHLESVNVMN